MATVKEPTSRLSARTLVLLTLGGIGLLSVLLVIGSVAVWRQRNVNQIQTELERIGQAGEPTTAEELAAYYPASPEATATATAWLTAVELLKAPAFEAAITELCEAEKVQGGPPIPGKPWPLREKAEQLLQQYATSLEQLHAAAECGTVAHYPAELHKGFAADNSHLQALRNGARLLQVEAQVRAYEGDPVGTARAVHVLFMLAHSLENEPTLMAQLYQNAFRGIGHHLLQQLLPVVPFSSKDLTRLRDDVRAQDCETRLYRTMVGERAAGICIMEDPFTIVNPDDSNPGYLAAVLPLSSDKAFYLSLMGRLVAAARQPWPQAIQQAGQVDHELYRVCGGGPGRVRYLITSLLLSGETNVFGATGRGIAQRETADATIAIELYRQAHGRLPEQLPDLMPQYLPKMPQDPFSGQSLRYVLQAEHYLVYSVGVDGVDSGGTFEQGPSDRHPPDIGLKMPRERKTADK